jgi:hypothetical protein
MSTEYEEFKMNIFLKRQCYRKMFFLFGLISILLYSPKVVAEQIGFTLNFEKGTTDGWVKTGTAFNYQPTLHDNSTARDRGQPSNHEGNFWIGTFEKYQGLSYQKSGDIQGDAPKGTLTSQTFTIPKGSLSFLVGGGASFDTRVELLISGKSVLFASGKYIETMHRVTWDLNPWVGKQGQIRIVDNSSGNWGHINADDFQFSNSVLDGKDIIKIIKSAKQKVNGHFIHYGKGPYDWVYITADTSLLAKLTGLDLSTGYLTWDVLDINSFSTLRIASTGKFVIFGETTSNSSVAKKLANSIQKIDGHFIHYADDAYDWIYVTSDSLMAAKLTGLDSKTGYLTWNQFSPYNIKNININEFSNLIEFGANEITNNDLNVLITQGDMPHESAYFNTLTAMIAKSTSALIQAIYAVNSFLYTDPSVTKLSTFQDRKKQLDKALEVLEKYTSATSTTISTSDYDKYNYAPLYTRTDYSADQIEAIVNSGNVNKPVSTLMSKLNIGSKEAKKILDNAMGELSSKYKAEASWWDLAARAANLVSNAAQLTCTVLGATVAAGPATVAAGGLTIAETAVLAVTSTEALIKTSHAGVELIIGEDVDIEETVVASARDASGVVNDFVAIDKLFNPKTDDLANNIIYVASKGSNLLWDKKVTILGNKLEVTDKDMIKILDDVKNKIEDQAITTLLPGKYHLPDGTKVDIYDIPDKIKQMLEQLPEDDKIADIKKITTSCPFSQKVLGEVCINKTCQIDAFNCPSCARDEELKFKKNGDGYCEKFSDISSSSSSNDSSSISSCTVPECCAEKSQVCGNMCIKAGLVCCGDHICPPGAGGLRYKHMKTGLHVSYLNILLNNVG